MRTNRSFALRPCSDHVVGFKLSTILWQFVRGSENASKDVLEQRQPALVQCLAILVVETHRHIITEVIRFAAIDMLLMDRLAHR